MKDLSFDLLVNVVRLMINLDHTEDDGHNYDDIEKKLEQSSFFFSSRIPKRVRIHF